MNAVATIEQEVPRIKAALHQTLPAYDAASYLFGQGYPMAVVLEAIRREPELVTDAHGDIEADVGRAGRRDALRLVRAL